ncbi:hypothetical protein CNMCM8927_008974 [Aspergillus lentulus]|uniref:Xylanolytic transcriptional activator regulatory domain-containing protein n=1 Tax=Aspergillus lentulus TaxID=293939 RepID=A0AAN6BNR8_ASPLE|nr:hypothetical protein CNMCM8060_005022 [Aspergillus lentulus]KAF4198932.1 hypothetical protein CNMCM8694_007538 [Aspergillus lentulus]KAF4203296.1 hypothetical protein CNMCM8927_008974 [Aspergillus lentulus]
MDSLLQNLTYTDFALLIITVLILRIFYRAFLYPEFLTPLNKLPTPPERSLMRGNYTKSGSSSHFALLRHWKATVASRGLIRYYLPGNQERVLVTNVEALKDILVSKASDFVKPKAVQRRLSRITGNGLLLAEGEVHKVSAPAGFQITRVNNRCLENVVLDTNTSNRGVVEVSGWATRATLDIIGLAGLGHDFDSLQNPKSSLMRQYRQLRQDPSPLENALTTCLMFLIDYADQVVSLLPTKRMTPIKAASLAIRTVCHGAIEAKKRERTSGSSGQGDLDIATVALNSRMFTDGELVDQMMTFLAAGHGTTSHALQWAIYALCKHREIQDRLRNEVRSQLPSVADGGSVPSAGHLDSLLYLRAVCNETLRLYPPVPSTIREALRDTTVAGYHIPKGTVFSISPAVTNVDVELWGPDAGDFNPERWMQDGCANSGGVSDAFGFLTFLQGPRSCIGATFARAELACLLAVLVGRFRMELEDPNREEELTRRGVGAAPADGLRARKLAEIEQELQQLKNQLQSHDQRCQSQSRVNNVMSTRSCLRINEETERIDLSSMDKTIGSVSIPQAVVQTLLDEYYANYHMFLPILPGQAGFHAYTHSSDLLYSVVMLTALRRLSKHYDLYLSLVDVVRSLLATHLLSASGTIQTMQALLLLCHWPLPFDRNEDPSHALIAQATHLGLRLGLHRPGHGREFLADPSTVENMEHIRQMTWVACFVSNISVSAQLGLPATVQLDDGLLEILASKGPCLRETLLCQLQIASVASQISSALGGPKWTTGRPTHEFNLMIRHFETDLRVLEIQYAASWSLADHIVYLGTQLMLYIIAVSADEGRQASSPSSWVVCGYSTAICLVQKASAMESKWLFAPVRLHKIVLNAICFLLLLKRFPYWESLEFDLLLLNNTINQGLELLPGLSVTPGDFMSRALLLLDQFSQLVDKFQSRDMPNEFLPVKFRMGANVAFSTAVRARELIQKQQDHQECSDMVDLRVMQDIDQLLDLDWSELFGTGIGA